MRRAAVDGEPRVEVLQVLGQLHIEELARTHRDIQDRTDMFAHNDRRYMAYLKCLI